MGNFYTNYTLKGPSQQEVADVLAGRSAVVTPEQDGCVVVFDEESDGQNSEIIAELASRLSGTLCCPLLAVLNHDDDILWYQLYLSGELVDEYNSAPGYFETSDEEAAMAGPEGGNAKKLCAAFEANSVAEVEDILRKPSADDEGYLFAFERHADLVTAIGLPSFGVGAGFRLITGGELPEGLKARDLAWTREIIAARLLEDVWRRPIPGYHKVSFRAHPKLAASIPSAWMPSTWVELECAEQELSEDCRKATAKYCEQFKQLGFSIQGFKKLKRVLNPNFRDNGGINFLDESRCLYGQIIYNKAYLPSLKTEREQVIIAFTAVFQNEVLSCTNNMSTLNDTLPHHKVIRIESDDISVIHQRMVEQLKQTAEQPFCFSDGKKLQSWFDGNQREMFEDKVLRGLWVRMSDYEVEVARRKLPPDRQ